jgi:hypothetical protein
MHLICRSTLCRMLTLTLALGVYAAAGCGETTIADTTPATAPAASASPAPATQQPFQGTYHASVQGNTSVLKIEQSGQTVTCRLDDATIVGQLSGETVRGSVKDPESGVVAGNFTLTRKGEENLVLSITLRHPETGETLDVPPITYARGEPPPVNVTLDRDLVGRWRYTWTAVSDDITAATDTWLILKADGTYEYGYSKGGAGGAGGSIITDRGDASTGKWRCENRILLYQEAGSSAWQGFARYYVEGEKMMLTYDDGSKKIWYRQ